MFDSKSTVPEEHKIQDTPCRPRVVKLLIDTNTTICSISTVPEVHTILAKSTHNIGRYKDYDRHRSVG